MKRWKKQGLLNKAGLTHIAGWVRDKDAEKCQQAIEEAKEDVDKALSENS